MKKKIIINPKQIENSTAKITCGDEEGSGFLITDRLLLTAWHVVDAASDGNPIHVKFYIDGRPLELVGKLHSEDVDLDVALVEIEKPLGINSALPLLLPQVRYGERWKTFGYPKGHLDTGMYFRGVIDKINESKPFDIELNAEDISKDISYAGLSGSPLVVNGKVIGILTWGLYIGFGAISVLKIAAFLQKAGISTEEERLFEKVPKELRGDLDRSIPNFSVLDEMERIISSGGKHYLMHGSPGSGKTILTASFEPATLEIIGKYYLRIPNDPTPTTVKSSKEVLLTWIEDVISEKVSGRLSAKETITLEERVDRLPRWLEELSQFYAKRGTFGVIAFDGLDEVLHAGKSLDEFLGVIPQQLPANISILFSCTSDTILPATYKSLISDTHKIKITPLTLSQCETFIRGELCNDGFVISPSSIQKIAQRSEGHPLYLAYLTEFLREHPSTNIEEWVLSLPTIGGRIEVYYEQIWNTHLVRDADSYWISVTASQLRQPLKRQDFVKMLPREARYSFAVKFPIIRHLFKGGEKVSVYHNSFQLFIEEKGKDDLKMVNDNAVAYCNQSTSEYSTTNIIYHIINSSDQAPAIKKCDQEWADSCALISVEPNLVIADIRSAESLSIDLGEVSELIRIKLLLQRIRFRYNNVLAENAYYVFNALLSMNKAQDALKYILRDSQLLITDDEAILFLQKLYENNARIEAETLLEAIRSRYRLIYSSDESGSFSLQTLGFHFSAITMSSNSNFDSAAKEFQGLFKTIQKIKNSSEKQQKAILKKFQENLVASNAGYLLHRFNNYIDLAKRQSVDKWVPTDEWAYLFSLISIYFYQYQLNLNVVSANTGYQMLLRDIEHLITTHGYRDKDLKVLITALLEESERPDILAELIKKHAAKPRIYQLREANGVDTSLVSIQNIINEDLYLGYIDSNGNYPAIESKEIFEPYILSLLRSIGFITGKAYRLKAEKRIEEVSDCVGEEFKRLTEALKFSLRQRVSWERSYALPEKIAPVIYQKVTAFCVTFERRWLEDLILCIEHTGTEQLGLYTEGFREALFAVADVLSRHKDLKSQAFRVIEILSAHVDTAVQNRLERTPELLRIAELYGRIDSQQRAWDTYKRMLRTSMGPSWYKEDQLTLINSALRQSLVKGNTFLNQFKKFAAYLDFASGEMTFQRYVQQNKDSFIGSLVVSGNTSKAVEYLKYQILPDAGTVIENAEASLVDAPSRGESYVLGARAIIEASGIVSLLSKTEADPSVMWALSEIFIVNDEVFRYTGLFAKVQAQCINTLHKSGSAHLTEVYDRLIGLVLLKELKVERGNYIRDICRHLLPECVDVLGERLAAKNIVLDRTKGSSEKDSKPLSRSSEKASGKAAIPSDFSLPGIGRMDNFAKLKAYYDSAKAEVAMGNLPSARQFLIDGLKILHEDGTDVWLGRGLSEELGPVFDLLPETGTPAEILSSLKDFVLNNYNQDWEVVNMLIFLLNKDFTLQQTTSIVNVVSEHVEHLVCCEPAFLQRYSWMGVPDRMSENINTLLAKLLIWCLNHPHASIRKRTMDATSWLAQSVPQILLRLLFDEALRQDAKMSSELCALILTEISVKSPQAVWDFLNANVDVQLRCFNLDHFLIRHYFIQVGNSISVISGDAKAFQERMAGTVPSAIILEGETNIDEPMLWPVEEIIYKLNRLQILNRAFVDRLISRVVQNSQPLPVSEQIRAQRYVERSFFDEEIDVGSYEYLLRTSISQAVVQRVDKSNADYVASLLRIH